MGNDNRQEKAKKAARALVEQLRGMNAVTEQETGRVPIEEAQYEALTKELSQKLVRC